MRQRLHNARVFDGEQIRDDCGVFIEGGRIVDVTRTPTDHGIDLGGALLAPGFIDLQVNGGGGVLFNDEPSVETIRLIGAAHRRFGTTSYLPTFITDRPDKMRTALAAVAGAIAAGVPGVLGIHLEGPFINPAQKGAHNAAAIRRIEDSDLELLRAPRKGATLLTLAPECVDREQITALAAAGVIVFAGHTAATFDQAREALVHGIRGFTHLFNAMTQMTGREPGVVGAALAADCWCGVIADGHHVHPANLKLAVAQKPGRVFLVTDAMAPAGTTATRFVLDGRAVTRRGAALTLPDGTLAGSCLDMASAVRNAKRALDLPVEEALRMAALYPAGVLDLDHELGRIAPGYRANLVLLDRELRVIRSWIDGEPSAPAGP